MPVPGTAAVGDERDSRPLIGAEGSSSSSSSQGGSSSAAPSGTSGWRNLQKVYGSDEVQPPPQLASHGSIPEEGPGSPDPSFMRFNRGEASTEPPPEHEGSGLPLLQATLSRAQCLCLAQSGLSLAVVACAAVLGEPSWLRWLLLAGVAFGVVELGRVQMNGLSYEALSTRLRAAPPTYLLINTAQPPLMQARDIYTHIPPLVQARDMPCARRTHRSLAPGQRRTASTHSARTAARHGQSTCHARAKCPYMHGHDAAARCAEDTYMYTGARRAERAACTPRDRRRRVCTPATGAQQHTRVGVRVAATGAQHAAPLRP